MRKIVAIVITVWVVCFSVCMIDLFLGISGIHRKDEIRWSRVVEIVYKELFIAPIVAPLVVSYWMFVMTNRMESKMRENEDQDI